MKKNRIWKYICGINGSIKGNETLINLDEVGSVSLRKKGLIKSLFSQSFSQIVYRNKNKVLKIPQQIQ